MFTSVLSFLANSLLKIDNKDFSTYIVFKHLKQPEVPKVNDPGYFWNQPYALHLSGVATFS